LREILKKQILIISIFIISTLSSINPSKDGKYPAGFWHRLLENSEFITYGNPGWMKHIAMQKARHYEGKLNGKLTDLTIQDNFALPVLVSQYPDVANQISVGAFQNSLFSNNPTGTMSDYFDEVSYGQLNLTGTVFGVFTADQNMSYYEGDGNGFDGTFPMNAKGLVSEIVGKADATVNYGLYDNDGPDGIANSGDDDGYADAVAIIFAGTGPDWDSESSNIWPHQSSLGTSVEFTSNDISTSGGFIKVSTYFICPELAGTGGGANQIRDIGVFVHEFGHVLGMPDFYDRTDASEAPDFNDSEGIGEWCLMGTGSWGGDGSHDETPAHMSAWCKIQLGWITPTLITQPVSGQSIKKVETNKEVYKMWEDPYALSRYYLVENRQRTGFDKDLNGTGLLIYHVDENRRWGQNIFGYTGGFVNDDETHKMVDVEEADGFAHLDNGSNRGDSGDPFPGSSNNTTFSDATAPSAKDYNNMATGISVTNISASASTMMADFMPRGTPGYAIFYDTAGLSGWGWGYAEPDTSWGGVHFQATHSGELRALDIGFKTAGTEYEIKVYESFDGNYPGGEIGSLGGPAKDGIYNNQPGKLLVSTSGTVEESGWHTLDLPGGINISENQEFFVSIRILNQAYAVFYDPYSPITNRSYFSGDGSYFFADIGNWGNINIRARIYNEALNELGVVDHNGTIPLEFTLYENYPNPFNPSTTMHYYLPVKSNVVLTIYDILGHEVVELVNRSEFAGYKSVFWNGKNSNGQQVSGGVYLYNIQMDGVSYTNKMVLLK